MTDHPRCDDLHLCRRQAVCALPAGGRRKDHTAELHDAGKYDMLRRKDDLLAEGVSAVFGFQWGEAELQALCFDAGRFTATQARDWLLAWGFQPRLFRAACRG